MYSISQVLPHRPPMVLLDTVQSYDLESAVCRVTISQQSPFFDVQLNGVPSYIGVEYMAQTIAAYAGAKALTTQEQVRIGFLLGSRKYQCHANIFTPGQTLDVAVQLFMQDESGLSVFDCSVMDGKTLLASAKINVFQPADAALYIRQQMQSREEK